MPAAVAEALLVPLVLITILAFVRPWTVTDFTSLWAGQALAGEPIAVVYFLLIPMSTAFIAVVELRSKILKVAMFQTKQTLTGNRSG